MLMSLSALAPALAEDRQPSSGVLGLIQAAPGAEAALHDVVSSVLAVQFERRGVHFAPVQSDEPSSGLQQAAEQNTQYFILARYTTSSADFGLSVELYDVASRKSLATAKASGQIGLSLDSVVAQALNKALAGVVFRPPPAPPQASTQAAAAGQSEPAHAAATAAAQTEPATTVAAQTAAAQTPQPAAPHTAASQPAVPRARRLFAFSAGAAPFLPLGGPGGYAQLGVLASLSADYRFRLGPGELGVGLLTGLCAASVAGFAADGSLLMVPIGADVTYSMNEGGFPGILVRVSGGPAIMSLTTAYDGALSKAVPYVLAGMDLSFPFTPLLALSVELAWTAFFESASLTIMGFVPEITLYVRL
jgi:hypothetical protein